MSQLSHLTNRRGDTRHGHVLYDEIKEMICQGTFDVSERISVEDLRQRFGVSKQPVMTALHQLASDGLVTITPQVGCRIATYSEREVVDFFRMFGGFEGTIAAAAAERRSNDQVRTLHTLCAETARLEDTDGAQDRADGYRRLNRQFHATIHDMAHSQIMTRTSRRMWDLSDMLIATTGVRQPLQGAITERNDDHLRVVEAIEAGDPAAARTAMEVHIVATVALIRGRDLPPQ